MEQEVKPFAPQKNGRDAWKSMCVKKDSIGMNSRERHKEEWVIDSLRYKREKKKPTIGTALNRISSGHLP